ASDVVTCDLVDVQRAHLPHDRDELIVQDLEDAVHAGLAKRGQPPHEGPTNADGTGPEAKCLQDVGATAHAAIDEHRDAAVHRVHHLNQHADRRLSALFRAAAMVGDLDAVNAVAHRLLGVFACHDALQHELALDDL